MRSWSLLGLRPDSQAAGRTHPGGGCEYRQGVFRPHALDDEDHLAEPLQRNLFARGVGETEAALQAGTIFAVAGPCYSGAAPACDVAPEEAPESGAEGSQSGGDAAGEEWWWRFCARREGAARHATSASPTRAMPRHPSSW